MTDEDTMMSKWPKFLWSYAFMTTVYYIYILKISVTVKEENVHRLQISLHQYAYFVMPKYKIERKWTLRVKKYFSWPAINQVLFIYHVYLGQRKLKVKYIKFTETLKILQLMICYFWLKKMKYFPTTCQKITVKRRNKKSEMLQYSENPNMDHLIRDRQVLCYLKGPKTVLVLHKSNKPLTLIGFCDTNWGNSKNCHSVTVYYRRKDIQTVYKKCLNIWRIKLLRI